MALKRASPTRDGIVSYIRAVLFESATKTSAYKEYINSDIKNVMQAVAVLEKREDFQAIYHTLNTDNALQMQEMALRLQKKYGKMVEKNLDVATEVLEKAETIKDKATAVRLVNETVGAMSVVVGNGGQDNGPNKKLDRGGSIVV